MGWAGENVLVWALEIVVIRAVNCGGENMEKKLLVGGLIFAYFIL